MGIAALGPVSATEITGPEKWFPSITDPATLQEASPTLLPAYAHAEAMPTSVIPPGMGYVRLQAGSLPVESSSWDADSESYGYENTEVPKGSQLRVIGVTCTDRGNEATNTNAEFYVWYDHRLYSRVNTGSYSRVTGQRLFSVVSNEAPIKVHRATAHETKKNVMVLQMTRRVSLTETLRVRVRSGSVYANKGKTAPAAESSELNVSIKLARNCYVLVVNRTSDAIKDGSSVIIGKPITVFDSPSDQGERKTQISVYDIIPSGGGGGGVDLLSGVVLGGNSESVRTPTSTLTPTSNVSYPVPLYSSDGSITADSLPIVEDWASYPDVIPGYLDVDDPLPVLPDGLCFVQLERPYSALNKAWDAAYEPNIVLQASSPPTAVKALFKEDTATIKVYFDSSLGKVGTGLVSIVNTTDNNLLVVTSKSISANVLSIQVKDSLDVTKSYSVTVGNGAVYTPASTVPVFPVGTPILRNASNTPATLGAIPQLLSGSVAVALNRAGTQEYKAGDRVTLANNGLSIPDTEPESGGVTSRQVLEVLSIISTGPAKTHIYVVEGGNIVATIPGLLGIKLMPTTPATAKAYDPNTYPTCEDGFGYVRSIDDGRLHRLMNTQPYSSQGLIRGQRILCYNRVKVQITGAPFTYQTFLTTGATF